MFDVFVFVSLYVAGTSSIQINFIRVPNAVQNNSNRPVILDCDYSVRPDDTGLVVKWFLNDDVVYQWIPPQKPQSMGLLKGRVDLNYEATGDPKTVYRSMKITNPTNDIEGEYKCFVSTFADEDFSIKNMIVFEPETKLYIVKNESNDIVNFTCYAIEVYPTPKLMLYREIDGDFYNKNRIPTVEWDVKKISTGRYSMFIVASIELEKLDPGILIHCELRIPGTGYVKIKSLLYYPDDYLEDTGTTVWGNFNYFIQCLLIYLIALFI